jgi:hypothetical protein
MCGGLEPLTASDSIRSGKVQFLDFACVISKQTLESVMVPRKGLRNPTPLPLKDKGIFLTRR